MNDADLMLVSRWGSMSAGLVDMAQQAEESSFAVVAAADTALSLGLWGREGLIASVILTAAVVAESQGADALNGRSHRMTW
jgi:hypothetical protein